MYKATVRALVRRGVNRLNAGDPSALLRMASNDVELAFPGENTWSTMYRPVEKGRRRHVTHRGRDECRAFAERFVTEGVQLQIEDILVNGPPWNLRVAIRSHDFRNSPETGRDDYNNRVVAFLEMRWAQIVRWEDYEDTERVAAWDGQREVLAPR
jgi:ketosteroid isomerase-like protein